MVAISSGPWVHSYGIFVCWKVELYDFDDIVLIEDYVSWVHFEDISVIIDLLPKDIY